MDSHRISLTGMEVVYLTDSVLNGDVAEGGGTAAPLARPLLLKLGSAYCELVHETGIEPGPVEIALTEEETWLLRSKVKTGDLGWDENKTKIGVHLLLKLYAMLALFNAEIDDLPTKQLQIDEAAAETKAIEYLRGVRDARGTDKDTDRKPDPDAGPGA